MNHFLGVTATLTTAILWGSNHVVARGMRELLSLPAFAFWRWFVALAFLTIFARSEIFQSRAFLVQNRKQIILSGIGGVGLFSYFLLGGAYMSPAVEVGLLNATTPIWVLLISVFMGVDKERISTWAGLVLSLAGTVLVIAHGNLKVLAEMNYSAGNLLTLSAAIVFAWFSIQIRMLSSECTVLVLTIVTAWVGLIFVLLPGYLISLLFGQPILFTGAPETFTVALSALVYVAFIPTMAGNLLFLYGVKSLGPTYASVFLYLSPVFSALFAILFLGENLEWYHIAGFAIIVFGLIIVNLSKSENARKN